jgi:hypothetical protein
MRVGNLDLSQALFSRIKTTVGVGVVEDNAFGNRIAVRVDTAAFLS